MPDGTRVAGDGPARADAITRTALKGSVTSGSSGDEVVAAVPVGAQELIVAVVRAALPQAAVNDRVHHAWMLMAAIGIGAIIVSIAVAVVLARRLSRPLDALAAAAERLGDGDFVVPVDPTGLPEFDTVAGAMTSTAKRLSAVLGRERAFSADASHQLRTPLTALRLRLESALLSTKDDLRPAVSGALEEIDRLERTVSDLLRLARDAPGDRKALDVAGILEDAQTRWRDQLVQRGRPLHIGVPEALPSVAASESAVRQILDVLIDNAVKHGKGAVDVAVHELASGISIEVRDEGSSISGDGELLFERRRSGRAGSGIGLALARSLAEGGRLILVRYGATPVWRLVLVNQHARPAGK